MQLHSARWSNLRGTKRKIIKMRVSALIGRNNSQDHVYEEGLVVETLTYLQANESNGCPLHTTCFRHNCEERGRWSWCLICPAAKHRENSLEISPVLKIRVWQPFCKDISNNTQQLPGRTVLQISFNYVLKYIFSRQKLYSLSRPLADWL